MNQVFVHAEDRRYRNVDVEKARGVTYTPPALARFVAERMIENADLEGRDALAVLDPAIGDGALVLALLDALRGKTGARLRISAFDTDPVALDGAARRIRERHPHVELDFTNGDFLDFALLADDSDAPTLFGQRAIQPFDLVIANPPYVRTQILGADRAQWLARAFGLEGRVDLYQAFLLGMARVLAPTGTTGVIVSNRFMTTKGGGMLRGALRQRFSLRQVWDLGDTRLFDAAVLPAVVIARGASGHAQAAPFFASAYEAKDAPQAHAADAIAALGHEGIVAIADGRRFHVRRGLLDDSGSPQSVWRLASRATDEWLAEVDRHAWGRFGDIGKIRVGVKTCADKVFIREDWDEVFGTNKPELLRPLTTHHVAGRFRAMMAAHKREILYPHEVVQGRRQPVELERFPRSDAYLQSHRRTLERRSYVLEAGRRWYELWVPQDPAAWSAPKLVFRDISERPTFWMDMSGAVVNGDCYWLAADRENAIDLLWLAAAVANSTFAEAFYDRCFNNKLYAGRRRFITQYVERFPLPDPTMPLSRDIVACARAIHEADHAPSVPQLERDLDERVWRAFGSGIEEVPR